MDDSPDQERHTSYSPTTYMPPSIHNESLLRGDSYTHFSPVPPSLQAPASHDADTPPSPGVPVALGVDEAGRGPVLGPMVYGVFYLPIPLSDPLLRETHHFDDSKVLTPQVRSHLMRQLCTPSAETDSLHQSCGWAISSLSARDIGAHMLRPPHVGAYNLNAQAMDATVDLIRGVYARGVNVQEIYVDTIGQPAAYQAKLQRVFPTAKITVAKKADSLYPCVSAASVCAKVTRDAALERLYEARAEQRSLDSSGAQAGEASVAAKEEGMAWGSGYPSDARCVAWLKTNMHPVFGWGPECRFSWGTAKDMLEEKGGVKVTWPVEDDGDTMRLTDYGWSGTDREKGNSELGNWFGTSAGLEAF